MLLPSDSLHGMRAVCDGPTRTQRRRDEHGFGNLRIRRACLSRLVCTEIDAIGALGCERDGDGISSSYFLGIAPSAKAALSKATNACRAWGRMNREILHPAEILDVVHNGFLVW